MAFETYTSRKFRRYYYYECQARSTIKIFEVEKALAAYEEQINVLTWIPSFIPGTRAYKIRKNLAKANKDLATAVREDIKTRCHDQPWKKFQLETRLFPSALKMWLIVLLFLITLAIALTGIGALAGLGVFGGFLAGLAITKSALTLCTIALGAIHTNLLSIAIITGISSYLSCLFLCEWRVPGNMLNMIPLGIPFVTHNQKTSLRSAVATFLSINLLLTNEFEFSSPISKANVIGFLVNPPQWLSNILFFMRMGLNRLLEIGTERGQATPLPQKILKGIVHFVFSLIMIPAIILQLPIFFAYGLAKGIFYDLPVAIHHEVTRVEDQPAAELRPTPVVSQYRQLPPTPRDGSGITFVQDYNAQQYGSGYGVSPSPASPYPQPVQSTSNPQYTY